jgi:hypothetical protein
MCLFAFFSGLVFPTYGYGSSQWLDWAGKAWKYFEPGVGVNVGTGLSQAKLDWPYITDWDLGGYIVAVIHANMLGLIPYGGTWGFSYRVNLILQFLENRELGVNGNVSSWPYWAYSSVNKSPLRGQFTNPTDHGRLLYALDMLRKYDPTTASRVSSIFQRSKSASDVMSTQVGGGYYGYLTAQGFKAFGYDMSTVISNFENWSGAYVDVEGVSLPAMHTTMEPILHGILELRLGGKFGERAELVYKAQEARFTKTGQLTAWSEGVYAPNPTYIYEWILASTRPWVITGADGSEVQVTPLMYAKVAFGLAAMFGENTYTSSLVAAASTLADSQYGFGEALYENGQRCMVSGSYTDKTNQLIIAAAFYALNTPLSIPFYSIKSLVVEAPPRSVYVVLPDYGRGVEGPGHVPKPKSGGVYPALATDIFASAYVLGSFTNGQYEVLDTSQYVKSSGQPNFSASYPVISFGSFWVNTLVNYYDDTGQSLVYLTFRPGTEHTIIHRSTGRVLVSLTTAQRDNGVMDYFVVQAFEDREGRNVFLYWGIGWKGTYAAAVYFVRYMLPNIDQYTYGWYLYKWNEASSGQSVNSIPDAGDEYVLIDSGD